MQGSDGAGREHDARHDLAVARGEPGYVEPATGLFVFTSAFLADRGSCCGNGCRHCPYDGRSGEG